MSVLSSLLDHAQDLPGHSFSKGDILQHAETLRSRAIYVRKGLLRSYIIDSQGKEHIYMFAPEGWIIGDIEAMEFEQPAQLTVDCLEDAEVVFLEKDYLFKPDQPREAVAEGAQLLYRRIARLQRRILMQMGAPIADRYLYFLETYPDLSERVPQHMIASFLGVAPQTLSTVKSKLSQKP